MSVIRKDRKTVIGILGGGQLARMSAMQAIRLGFDVAILDKEKNSPAGVLTKKEFVGWVDQKKVFDEFIEASDIITLENEFIDYTYLEYIKNKGKKVIPDSKTISLIQDKLIQKTTFDKAGIPVAKFIEVNDRTNYESIKTKLGNKFVLKSRKMGYDGYGNATVKNKNEFMEALQRLSKRHTELYAEKFVPFVKELAIMVVRTKKEIKTYPVVETIQRNHICHTVIAPAVIKQKTVLNAREVAIEAVKAIKGYGIFGIEFFLLDDDSVLVNEIAPRPHNTGHYTIEACTISQFENHIRAALDLPLGNTELVKPFAVMINLLGKRNGVGVVQNYSEAFNNKNVHLHIYGKAESRIGRKMGHITLLGNELNTILSQAKKIEKKIIV
ncbi:5-(carboxyamino)imidazole ribonucleotide synthase [Ignavibacterium album JCM 16511]|uniref:N5-carboxyaminoimidazole ribonucleotide synthase n=1 Tax=Ignavibacterium album (strain DSM 19864 / JCM 16511 / NBRC 101810 / Mat9-16) TaxID=945713 RepID=I0AKC1_IGNAJ|nr:5-(carboxyamino)imidazole ribonucleotide synthase [Ignavibacterium album]AFH49428.1 5-(carboxyamino)imidazole ribonucleotide synthase [Ignavibacterium album JCM 16511]